MHPLRSRPARSLAAAASGFACAAALVVVTAPPAAAESWSVPRDARVTVVGHGYGHGHGMSQHGAEGAARQGLDHREIIDFYYPGTGWGRSSGYVRVNITADTTDDLVVRSRSGLLARDLGTGESWTLPENGATQWRLAVADGRTRLAYRTDRWRRWRTFSGEGELGAGGAPMTLLTPAGERSYRGRLRAAAPRAGSTARDTVNILRLEAYLRGVVPREIPALWSPEAVQAQAVAARTYAAYERAHPRASHYDFCDTTSCQVYGGASAEHPASDAAIRATARQVRLSGGEPAFTQFSSSSGGWTAAGSVPYLVAQRDPYDDWPGNSVHDWSAVFSDEAVERRFPAIGNLTRIVVNSRDGNGDWGGRVRSVTFVGGRGRATVSGDTARWRLGVRSTYFTFRVARG